MTKHVLIGRMGDGDTEAVATRAGEVASVLQLVSGDRLDHGIGRALDHMKVMKLAPSEIGGDLLVLAAHVHAADTRISRNTESEDAWTREMRLVVPVSEPQRWNGAATTLKRMLDFLTGDRWTLEFRARPVKFATIVPPRTDLIGPPFDGVNLFSGGLDSLIGAIDTLKAGKTPLLVSHAGEGLVSKSQDICFDGLKKALTKAGISC